MAPRLRWGYLFVCLGLSVVALLASLGVAMLLPVQTGDMPASTVNDFTSQTRDFILVILLLTPLQAAGEEYLFRGYLTQAFGSLVWARQLSQALAVLGPALIFALFHGLSPGLAGLLRPLRLRRRRRHPRDPHRRPGGAASRCTCSTTSWPSGWRSPSAT